MQPPFDIPADLDTPVSAYLKLAAFQPRFLLESVEGGDRLGRYSFIGFGRAVELRLDAGGMHLGGREALAHGAPLPEDTEPPADGGALLETLRAVLARCPQPGAGEHELPFRGGLVGAAGYDLVRYFEPLAKGPARHAGLPEAAYVAPESLLVFDHLTRRAALLHAGGEEERRALRRDVIGALAQGLPARAAGVQSGGEVSASLSRAEFLDAVALAKEHIAVGDIYQIVLSVRFAGLGGTDPFEAYRALRLLNPSPYMFFLDLGELKVVGSSPEALVRLHGRQAWLRPIAGTRPRGDTPQRDLAHERELLADPKENAEHVMLVDLARNDLGRVAAAGSVRVEPYRSIERYSHVMHIVSGVTGELAPGRDAFDLFAAAFPAGTLVGAPKVRAMQIIDELEPVSRGIYGGTVGYFGHGGNMDQAIAIRTLVFHGDEFSYQAGAGIVADSVPDNEYEEVLAKSAILRRALAMAEAGL